MQKKQSSKPRSASPSASNRLALATGSLSALSVLSFSAQAAIIFYDTPIGPITTFPPPSTNTTWDVDGKGGAEFRLKGVGYTSRGTARAMLTSDGLNGRGLIQQLVTNGQGGYNAQGGYVFQNLRPNFLIGPTLAKGYGFGYFNNTNRKLASSKSFSHQIAGSAVGFGSGVNGYFGFQFTSGGDTFYGWAELNIDGPNLSYTINRWAYNENPGGLIQPGQTIPEPDTLSLTLLGLGAGGVRAWRRRKQAL